MHAVLSRFAAGAVCLASVGGCTPARGPAPLAGARVAPAGGADGVIVAERPLRPGTAGIGDMRTMILATLGDTALPATAAATEFVVREDSGRMISVVQDNPERLRPGERVTIRLVPRARLIRAVSGMPLAQGG